MSNKLLIVDDEQEWLDILSLFFTDEEWDVRTAPSSEVAWLLLRAEPFDLVLCDMSMPGLDGIGLLKQLRAAGDETPFIVMTGVGTIRTAVEAVKLGAYDYLTKPFASDDLQALAARALGHGRMQRALREDRAAPPSYDMAGGDALSSAAPARACRPSSVCAVPGATSLLTTSAMHSAPDDGFPMVLGANQALRLILTTISKVAGSTAPVLIQGETGTGKSLLARHIHEASPRRAAPLLTIDCGSLPEHLLESELFGHVKGAFTGALNTRKGLLEEAQGGTVFLDEVGELPPAMQVKLLRAIQEKEIRPVGGNRSLRVDVRFLCATNRDLKRAVEEGAFRKDLYYRLAVVPVTLPPLRERLDDLVLFVGHFVRKFNAAYGKHVREVSPAALDILLQRPWEGNIRELENVMERAMLLTDGEIVTPASLGMELSLPPDALLAARSTIETSPVPPESVRLPDAPIPLHKAVEDAERRAIALALALAGGNRKQAALLLGIGRRTLYHKLEGYEKGNAQAGES